MNSLIRSAGIIVLFNVMLVFAILAMHEAGHYFMGVYAGCEGVKAVLLDSGGEGPYTELSCFEGAKTYLPYAGSLIFTVGFGLLFLFFGNAPERNLFLVVLGLSILTAGMDVVMLTSINALYYVSIFVGVFLIAVGEIVFGISLAATA